MQDERMARKSLGEEKKAVEDYGKRGAKASDRRLKGVFAHNRKEEREHARKLTGWLRKKARKA